MRNMKRNSGFTLVEAAVGVLIVSILLSGGMKYYKTWMLRQAQDTTRDRLDTIKTALKDHVITSSRLPCPAPLDDEPDNSTYGQETSCTTATAPAGTTDAAGRGGKMVRIGAVPVRKLGLPDSYMTDAWGRRFLYAVTKDMAHDPAVSYRNNDGAIFLHDVNGHSLTKDDGRGLYVILSHGVTGLGGYLANGHLYKACDTGAHDGENCDGDATFAISQNYSEASGTDTFDDITLYNVKQYVPAPAVSRYVLDSMSCNDSQGGYAMNVFGFNCASYRFSGADIFSPASVGQLIYSRTLTAQTDGTVMVRAIVPVIYDNSLITVGPKWEQAIMGALEIDGVIVARDILVDPASNSILSAGWSGMILGSAPIVKGTDYTINVRVFSLGNSTLTTPSAWAGTIRFGIGGRAHDYAGMVEIMEGSI